MHTYAGACGAPISASFLAPLSFCGFAHIWEAQVFLDGVVSCGCCACSGYLDDVGNPVNFGARPHAGGNAPTLSMTQVQEPFNCMSIYHALSVSKHSHKGACSTIPSSTTTMLHSAGQISAIPLPNVV